MSKKNIFKYIVFVSVFSLLGCAQSNEISSILSTSEVSKYQISFVIGDNVVSSVEYDENTTTVPSPVCSETNFYYIWEAYSLSYSNQVVQGKKCELKTELDISDESMINYFGRNQISEDGSTFYNSNSGFEINFVGTTLSARFVPTFYSNTTSQYVRVHIDNDTDGKLVKLTSKGSYKIASNLQKGLHNIQVYKVNSEAFGDFKLEYFSNATGYIEAPFRKNQLFEFYGDSITAGYGINGLEGDTVENEDSTLAWAKRLSDSCNAEISSLAYSGVSLSLKYWIKDWRVVDTFDQVSYVRNKTKWDFKRHTPSVVFINLGTNDANGITASNKDTFKNDYLSMVQTLRSHYPNASIVMVYGMMGTNVTLSNAIRSVLAEADDPSLYYLNARQVSSTGYNYHPSSKAAAASAKEVKQFLIDNNIYE